MWTRELHVIRVRNDYVCIYTSMCINMMGSDFSVYQIAVMLSLLTDSSNFMGNIAASNNNLLHVQGQPIIWNGYVYLQTRTNQMKCRWNLNKNTTISTKSNVFENVVCKSWLIFST